MRWLLLYGVLAASFACGSSSDCGVGSLSFEIAEDQSAFSLAHQLAGPYFRGEEVTLAARVSTLSSCPLLERASLTIEVEDPSGRVDVASSEKVTDQGNHTEFLTSFRFTPETAGAHVLIARLAPELAETRQQLEVFAPSPGPAQPVRVFESRRCFEVHRTSTAWICDGKVLRGADEVQSIEGSLSARGAILWAATEAGLERFEDTGTGPLVTTGALPVELGGIFGLHVRDNEALVLTGASLRHFGFELGVVSERGRYDFATGTFAPRAVIRREDRAVVAGDSGDTSADLCSFTLGDGILPLGACARISGRVIGADDRAVWIGELGLIRMQRDPYVGEFGYSTLERFEPDEGSGFARAPISLPDGLRARGHRGAVWVDSRLHRMTLIPRERAARWVLERFVAEPPLLGGTAGPFLLGHEESILRTSVFDLRE